MNRLILFLIRKKLGLKKDQEFYFKNQAIKSDRYFIGENRIHKIERYGSYMRVQKSANISLSFLLSDDIKGLLIKEGK